MGLQRFESVACCNTANVERGGQILFCSKKVARSELAGQQRLFDLHEDPARHDTEADDPDGRDALQVPIEVPASKLQSCQRKLKHRFYSVDTIAVIVAGDSSYRYLLAMSMRLTYFGARTFQRPIGSAFDRHFAAGETRRSFHMSARSRYVAATAIALQTLAPSRIGCAICPS